MARRRPKRKKVVSKPKKKAKKLPVAPKKRKPIATRKVIAKKKVKRETKLARTQRLLRETKAKLKKALKAKQKVERSIRKLPRFQRDLFIRNQLHIAFNKTGSIDSKRFYRRALALAKAANLLLREIYTIWMSPR